MGVSASTINASSDPYDSGYDHGCDDAKISDSSDGYVNQPEKVRHSTQKHLCKDTIMDITHVLLIWKISIRLEQAYLE